MMAILLPFYCNIVKFTDGENNDPTSTLKGIILIYRAIFQRGYSEVKRALILRLNPI